MDVFVRTMTGKAISVRVPRDATTRVLKAAITAAVGIGPEWLRLIYDGRQLADDMPLGDCYGVQSCSTIFLVMRSSAPASVQM